MTDGQDKEDQDRKIRNYAVSSLCFSLLVFVIVPIVTILDNLDLIDWLAYNILMFTGVPMPILGAIFGHVALKKIRKNPETPRKYRRLALSGAIVGYGWMAFCMLVFLFFWFLVFPNLFHSH